MASLSPANKQNNYKFKKGFKKNFKQNGFGKKFNPNQIGKKPMNKFLSSIKRLGKRGNYGRGTDIEEEQFKYFVKIYEEMQKRPTSFDERVAMANNVLEETKGQEIHLASNQLVSRVVEEIIGYAGEDHFERFLDVFGENFRPICSDRFASHCLQKLVEISFLRACCESRIEKEKTAEALTTKPKYVFIKDYTYNMDKSTTFSKDHQKKCAMFVERISKFLLNNLEDFISDTCGSHLIRTCVNSLAGVHMPKKMIRVQNRQNAWQPDPKTLFTTTEAWHEILKEFPSRLEMWPQLPELVYKDTSSALLGVICTAISHVDTNALTRFGKKLIQDAFLNAAAAKTANKANLAKQKEKEDKEGEEDEDDDEEVDVKKEESGSEEEQNDDEESGSDEGKTDKKGSGEKKFPAVFTNEYSVYLLESLIHICGPKLLTEIYKTLFDDQLIELTMNRRACFPVKALLQQITDKNLFEKIFDQLEKHFENFIGSVGNVGIFPAISGACLRLNTKQAAFFTAIQSALHCTTAHGEDRPKSFLRCLLKFKKFEDITKDEKDIAFVVGSMVAQDILRFKKPIFLVNCILESFPRDLTNMFISKSGSFVADVFLKSETIGEKSREKFIKLLDGFYMDMALTVPGSRVLERLFELANDTQRLRIAKELTSQDNRLKSALSGRILYNKFRLETYKKSSEQWTASWHTVEKKEDELNEIVKVKTEGTSEEKKENTANGTPVVQKKRTESASEGKNGDVSNGTPIGKKKKRTVSVTEVKKEDFSSSPVVKKKKKTESMSEEKSEDTPNVSLTGKKKKKGAVNASEEKNEDVLNVSTSIKKKKKAANK